MLYAAEYQQILDRHALEIDDLRTIARLHGLPTGAPEHLLVLPLRLSQDFRLRADMTELVRSLQTQDPELGLPDALSIVLAAIGGSSNLDRRRDLDETVNLMGGFLVSLGGWPGSLVEPTIDIDNPPDHDPRLDLAASSYTETLDADLARPAAHQEEITVSTPAAEAHDETLRDPNGAVTLAEITHALSRLERGNLELRLHLDSIDQRICRMEPLLEAAPHTEPPSPPPDPPRRSPLPASSPAEARDLLHRGSSPPDAASPQDRLEEVKALRRISLRSNFPDPSSPSAHPLIPASTPLRRSAELSGAGTPPGPIAGTASPARAQLPRRDRFAAAREIPGNAAETDPLYTGLEEEQASAGEPRPDARAALAPEPLHVVSPASPSAESAPEHHPMPAPLFVAETASQVAATTRDAPAAGSRARLIPEPVQSHEVSSAAPLFRSTSPLPSAMPVQDPPARSRSTTWIAGVAAAAVLGAAGYLYVNGLPSPINEWVGGSSASVSSNPGMEASPIAGESQPAAATTAASSPAEADRSTLPRRGAKATADASAHVLGARESFSPSASVEKTKGPTFVPGGIMDGHLISAPRPVYPEMASLVGAQGKVTFEAMVSKAGQVEAVKVLGGPQVLRSAATDAVKQWQYRPFEVRGQPVEVRTIIRVDVASHAGSAATE